MEFATPQELEVSAVPKLLTKAQLSPFIRNHINSQLYDESHAESRGTAIYTLADPRDLRLVRYVGQTSAPRRRFMQHLSTARLWLPDEVPWWVESPRLRPLYDWIRALHREEFRLPTMVVYEWHQSRPQARLAERRRIIECLHNRLPILNFEAELLGSQIPLI